jgi:ubiquinol-cytochrome c reductase cytochrome b subunit
VTKQCTSCHLWKGKGDDGDQGLAPELSGYGSVAWVRAQVANPASATTYRPAALDAARKGHMPRFDDQLGAADLDVIAQYTRAHARSTVPR